MTPKEATEAVRKLRVEQGELARRQMTRKARKLAHAIIEDLILSILREAMRPN